MTRPLPTAVTGILLIGHGIVHLVLGLALTANTAIPGWQALVVTLLWLLASTGSIAAGLGVWRLAPFWRYTRGLALLAAISSILLLALFWHSIWDLGGLMLDFAVIALFLPPRAEWLNVPDDARFGMLIAGHHRYRWLGTLGVLLLLGVAVVVVTRPFI